MGTMGHLLMNLDALPGDVMILGIAINREATKGSYRKGWISEKFKRLDRIWRYKKYI